MKAYRGAAFRGCHVRIRAGHILAVELHVFARDQHGGTARAFPGSGDAKPEGRSERATSVLDQRDRAVLNSWWIFARNWNVGAWTSLASGRPYNITTGVDNNGDNSTADRPVINGAVIARNAGRGTPVYDLSTARLGRTLKGRGSSARE